MSNTIYSNQIKVNCPLIHDENGLYHLIYKVTNIVNDKIYVGKHSTKDPYDNYLGSGIRISRAIKEYGKENFIKEIMYCFTNENEAFLKEEEVVTQEFVDRNDTYNMTTGGHGFGSGEANPMHNKETRDKVSKANSGENNPNFGKSPSKETRDKISKANSGENNGMYGMSGEKNPMYGKHHTQKSKDKISKALKGKYVGENSPNYGKHLSEETKDKLSKSHKGKHVGEKAPWYGKYGENHPCYGKHLSQEHKGKISKANAGENNGFAKAIIKLDESGNIITEYGCMKECCAQENISNRKKLNKLIKERILYNGFYFEFKYKN